MPFALATWQHCHNADPKQTVEWMKLSPLVWTSEPSATHKRKSCFRLSLQSHAKAALIPPFTYSFRSPVKYLFHNNTNPPRCMNRSWSVNGARRIGGETIRLTRIPDFGQTIRPAATASWEPLWWNAFTGNIPCHGQYMQQQHHRDRNMAPTIFMLLTAPCPIAHI